MNLMNAEHPDWDEFCGRLEGPEGCNFQEDEAGKITWDCAGGTDQTYAEKILKAMNENGGEIDVEGSLAYYRENGGHCDCEILFNVDT